MFQGRSFLKLHGLGNDFVLLDARDEPVSLSAAQAALIADRHVGIGADQVLTLLSSDLADGFLRIQNVCGREVEACGNATRCVADYLLAEVSNGVVAVDTMAGTMQAERVDDGRVRLSMGKPDLHWSEIPLARKVDTRCLPLVRCVDGSPVVSNGMAVGMGNPHAVFFVDSLAAIPVEAIGPGLETDPLFPEGANIGFAEVVDDATLRLRVWERSVGLTLACATGSCAAVVAGHISGRLERQVSVYLDGGCLSVEWRARDDQLFVVGPAERVFEGRMDKDFTDRLDALSHDAS